MTQGSLDFDFIPPRRNYRQLVGFAWHVEAHLEDESGQPIDLTDYTIASVTKDNEGNEGQLTITRSLTDPTVFYYGQDVTTVSIEWLVTLAAPGGPAIPQYFGNLTALAAP